MIKKIIMSLVTVVACILVGAFILNIFVPNLVIQIGDALEMGAYRATGLSFDFNGNGNVGKTKEMNSQKKDGNSDQAIKGAEVEGFN